MEIEEVELYFNEKIDIKNIMWRPGLYYEPVNKYTVYTNKKNISFYIVHLPYDYYLILPFSKISIILLKNNCWRFNGKGIVGLDNKYIFGKDCK